MSELDDLRPVVDMLIEGESEAALEHLLMENEEQKIVRALGGDRTIMNYLLKFEEYLSEHDVYLFDGWEEVSIIHTPIIDQFWTTFHVFAPEGTDLRGAARILNDRDGAQNEVKYKKTKGGTILVFKILKRYLNDIEARNQENAEEFSRKEMEYL